MRLEVGATGGVTEHIALRGSVVYDNRDEGYRRNIALGGRTGGDESTTINLSALIQPSSDLSITLRANDQHRELGSGWELLQNSPTFGTFVTPDNVGGVLTFPNPLLGGLSFADFYGLTFPTATAGVSLPHDPNDLTVAGDTRDRNETDISGVSATVEWRLGGATLKSITAWRNAEWNGTTDADGTNIPLFAYDRVQQGETWSQEFNLSGVAFDQRLQWLLGAYYYNDSAASELWVTQPATQTFYEALIGIFGGGPPLPSGSLQAFAVGNPLAQGIGAHQGLNLASPFLDFTMDQDSTSYAVFGEGTYHVTDDFALTIGARWTRDEKDVTRSFTSNYVSLLAPSSVCLDQRNSDSWEEVTGNIVGEYTLSEDSMVYGRASHGYKAGGYNIGECGGAFDPETIWAYEVGFKTDFFDRQARLNTAIFYYDYTDIQILRYITNTASVENASGAEVFGIETEFAIAPRALRGFQLSGSVSYLDSQYVDASFGNPFDAGGPTIDVSGNTMMRAPEWKASLAAQYAFQTDVGEFTLAADANYSGSYYFDVFEASLPNQSEMEQPSYTITNAHLLWRPNNSNVQVTLFGNNLGNELYAESRIGIPAFGGVLGQFSAPRTWGVRVAATFGAGN